MLSPSYILVRTMRLCFSFRVCASRSFISWGYSPDNTGTSILQPRIGLFYRSKSTGSCSSPGCVSEESSPASLLRRLSARVRLCGFRTRDGLLDGNIVEEGDSELDGRTLERRREMGKGRRGTNRRYSRAIQCVSTGASVEFRVRVQESSVRPNLYDNGNEPGFSRLHRIWQRSNPVALN